MEAAEGDLVAMMRTPQYLNAGRAARTARNGGRLFGVRGDGGVPGQERRSHPRRGDFRELTLRGHVTRSGDAAGPGTPDHRRPLVTRPPPGLARTSPARARAPAKDLA